MLSNRKYWDIIPPQKSKRKPTTDDRFNQLIEAMKRHSKENRQPMPYRMPFTKIIDADNREGCMHKNCSTCHGTGQGPFGPCLHMISCPCRSCTPWMGGAVETSMHYVGANTAVDRPLLEAAHA